MSRSRTAQNRNGSTSLTTRRTRRKTLASLTSLAESGRELRRSGSARLPASGGNHILILGEENFLIMESNQEQKESKLLGLFTGLFVAVLIMSNILSSAKFIEIWWLVMPAGVIVFPISFIFGDILTEVYGYTRSRKVIWTGFAGLLLMLVFILLAKVLPPASFWQDQAAYERLFAIVPRLAIGGFVAYLLGEFCNSFVMSKMKFWDKGKRGIKQGWRFVASTIVGEGVDTIVVMLIAFSGVLTFSEFVRVAVSIYVFKVLYEVVATPFSTRFANWVKRVEGTDKIDYPQETNYNPFAIFFHRN